MIKFHTLEWKGGYSVEASGSRWLPTWLFFVIARIGTWWINRRLAKRSALITELLEQGGTWIADRQCGRQSD